MLEFLKDYLGEHAWAGEVFALVLATAAVHWLVSADHARNVTLRIDLKANAARLTT